MVLCTGNLCTQNTIDYLRSITTEVHVVRGDYDDIDELVEEKCFTIGPYKVALIHGHQIIPWGNQDALLIYARKMDADIILSGHTHQLDVKEVYGKLLLNPGSATGTYGGALSDIIPSFALMDVQPERIIVYIYQLMDDNEIKIKKVEYKKPHAVE